MIFNEAENRLSWAEIYVIILDVVFWEKILRTFYVNLSSFLRIIVWLFVKQPFCASLKRFVGTYPSRTSKVHFKTYAIIYLEFIFFTLKKSKLFSIESHGVKFVHQQKSSSDFGKVFYSRCNRVFSPLNIYWKRIPWLHEININLI